MKIVMRLIPGVYMRVSMPQGLSEAEAIDYAVKLCRESKHDLCLVLSRKESVWIFTDGRMFKTESEFGGEPNEPYMQIGGKGPSFVLGDSDDTA